MYLYVVVFVDIYRDHDFGLRVRCCEALWQINVEEVMSYFEERKLALQSSSF